MTTNDITKDKIQTKPNSQAYREQWEVIYGKGKPVADTVDKMRKEMSKGR